MPSDRFGAVFARCPIWWGEGGGGTGGEGSIRSEQTLSAITGFACSSLMREVQDKLSLPTALLSFEREEKDRDSCCDHIGCDYLLQQSKNLASIGNLREPKSSLWVFISCVTRR